MCYVSSVTGLQYSVSPLNISYILFWQHHSRMPQSGERIQLQVWYWENPLIPFFVSRKLLHVCAITLKLGVRCNFSGCRAVWCHNMAPGSWSQIVCVPGKYSSTQRRLFNEISQIPHKATLVVHLGTYDMPAQDIYHCLSQFHRYITTTTSWNITTSNMLWTRCVAT